MSAIAARPLNRTLLLACTPFLGMLVWLFVANISVQLSERAYPQPAAQTSPDPGAAAGPALEGLDQAKAIAQGTGQSIKKQLSLYQKTNADMAQIASIASTQASRPYQIYDRRITRKLGSPAATIQSDKLEAQLFYLGTQNFQSYALKIKLKQKDAMKLVLGNDKEGSAETTLSAVNRYKAAIGVNAGGFADGGGKRYPLSTTVVGGKYIGGFQPTEKDLFFVGLNGSNKLIGGKFSSQSQLDALGPKFGASFVPILLKNGQRTVIPDKWKTSPKRAPRTVIANYKDDQLLFLIANGYNENGSSGATLEEMQILLQRYGALDGYNLDGGGSTSLVFNGRVINSPSDGTLRKLPTHFLFFR
ncbi:phosphodiester glycosidase family protein [Cohnella nanjingensis]|uniref:Phosphodiester glycosidase family protein n=1 Tax=Cohnella nanjingensis TaxID=1387779 RepID=A0A7X0RZT5_9BACL|nr:phosphodiester glycosidase family protein [Cohnella nanjingensis]MBB6675541.1 phosphodiester glycosidase family protein [Cohnella nanjingensis]